MTPFTVAPVFSKGYTSFLPKDTKDRDIGIIFYLLLNYMTALEEPFELLPEPTPILTLPPDEPEPEYTEEQRDYKRKKEKAQRCKVIAMDKLNLDPLKNTHFSSKAEKFVIFKEVERLFELPDEEIKAKFFEVCNVRVLGDDPKMDYSNYPIYQTRIPS